MALIPVPSPRAELEELERRWHVVTAKVILEVAAACLLALAVACVLYWPSRGTHKPPCCVEARSHR